MAMSFTTALDAEIADLERQLAADPRHIKLRELKRVRDLYHHNGATSLPGEFTVISVGATAPAGLSLNTGTFRASSVEPRRPGRQRSPEREQALEEIRKLLRGRTGPTGIREIDAHLDSKGIRIGGADALNNLSALLYTAGGFRSHGRAGWTLAEQEATQ
jgi:hypothetical protein